jgi:hypothetical protein
MLRLSVLVAAFVMAHAGTGAAQMEDKVSDEELKAFHDKHYPFVEHGAEPPGRLVPHSRHPNATQWSGLPGWRMQHGPALVWSSRGQPFKIESARYPDGTRGIAQHMLDYGWRRRAADGRRWIHGTIEIRPDDVLFTDGAQPTYTPPEPTGTPNLEADLARDGAFLAAIQDDRFAHGVYRVLGTHTFYKESDDRAWSVGTSEAARVVRDLRGLGESYQDWFPWGGLSGYYPDDRAGHETALQGQIARFSQPFDVEQMVASVPEEMRTQARARYQQDLPKMEEQRLKALESARGALARLDDNADVFVAIRDHLTRLGWRTENAQDRARESERRLAAALAVLAEIKELEKRPEAAPGEWTAPIRQSLSALPPSVPHTLRNATGSPPREVRVLALDPATARRAVILQRSGSAGSASDNSSPDLSAEEREVRSGTLRRRLGELAVTGRVSKDQYESLLERLGKTGFW